MTPMEGFYCFCEKIRTLRRVHLLSTREMADIMGINVKTLEMLERDILPKHLSSEAIFRMDEHIDIPPGRLFLPLS